MSAAQTQSLISVADYLAGELTSDVKHEYLGGIVHAMAGGRNVHNQISTNATAALHSRLRGKLCRAWNSDTKIKVVSSSQTRFYYPDASVVCDSRSATETYQNQPVVIVEVLSPSTRRIDQGEKLDWYLTIPSLMVYVMIDSERAEAIVYRRQERGFDREVYAGTDAVIPLDEVEIELPLAEVYEGVTFDSADGRETDPS